MTMFDPVEVQKLKDMLETLRQEKKDLIAALDKFKTPKGWIGQPVEEWEKVLRDRDHGLALAEAEVTRLKKLILILKHDWTERNSEKGCVGRYIKVEGESWEPFWCDTHKQVLEVCLVRAKLEENEARIGVLEGALEKKDKALNGASGCLKILGAAYQRYAGKWIDGLDEMLIQIQEALALPAAAPSDLRTEVAPPKESTRDPKEGNPACLPSASDSASPAKSAEPCGEYGCVAGTIWGHDEYGQTTGACWPCPKCAPPTPPDQSSAAKEDDHAK